MIGGGNKARLTDFSFRDLKRVVDELETDLEPMEKELVRICNTVLDMLEYHDLTTIKVDNLTDFGKIVSLEFKDRRKDLPDWDHF